MEAEDEGGGVDEGREEAGRGVATISQSSSGGGEEVAWVAATWVGAAAEVEAGGGEEEDGDEEEEEAGRGFLNPNVLRKKEAILSTVDAGPEEEAWMAALRVEVKVREYEDGVGMVGSAPRRMR